MNQVGGNHYEAMAMQPWEIIEANSLDFWEGNIIKYVMRYRSKNGVEDLKKARHYLEYLIARESGRLDSTREYRTRDHRNSDFGDAVHIPDSKER